MGRIATHATGTGRIDGVRRFLTAFGLAFGLGLVPLGGLTARLIQIGEIEGPFSGNSGAVQLHGAIAEDARYKYQRVMQLHPDVVVLGSSRVMQFRSSLFTCVAQPSCFYNAGGEMQTMEEGLEFVQAIAGTGGPRMLLLGLDPWDFNPSTPSHQPAPFRFAYRPDVELGELRTIVGLLDRTDIRDAVLGLRTRSGVEGLSAILNGTGYRPDGSYDYGPSVRVGPDGTSAERSRVIADEIAAGFDRWAYFRRADDTSLRELDDLLGIARDHGIAVIAFTPVFSPEVEQAIERTAGQRDGFAEFYARVGALLASRGVPFLAARSTTDVGCADDEHLDGWHPSEVCDARILLKILDDAAARGTVSRYVNAASVAALIAARQSSYSLKGD